MSQDPSSQPYLWPIIVAHPYNPSPQVAEVKDPAQSQPGYRAW